MFFLLLVVTYATAEDANNESHLKKLDVGVLAEGWGPFQKWYDNQPSGFSVELIERLASDLGYVIRWHSYPQWIDMYNDACLGHIDILLDSFDVVGRTCIINSTPYYSSPSSIVVRDDSKIFLDVNHLQEARIAVENGFLTEELVKLHYPKAKLLLSTDAKKALKAVEIGDADAYIGNAHVARLLTQGSSDLIVVAQSPLLMEALHIGINVNKPWLEGEINKAIKSISTKELGKLKLRWLGEDPITNLMGINTLILRPEERLWLSKLSPLKLGLPPSWPPFSFISEGNRPAGLAVDYLNLIKDNLGIAYDNVTITDWSKLYELVSGNLLDITILPMQRLSEMKDWHASESFISFPVVIVNKKDSAPLGDVTDLEGRHIFITDSMLLESLRKMAPNVNISISRSAYEGLSNVYDGNADAYIGNLVTLTRLIADHFDGDLHIAAPTPFKDELVFAVRTPLLPMLPLINRVLNSMTDKDKRQIRNSWLALNYSDGISLSKLAKTLMPIGSGLSVIIFVLVFSYFKLKREIRRRQKVELELVSARASAENASSKKASS
ncbi:transporter substrate-binding domain-containing protein [Aeromonas dhakensis]